MAGWFIWLCILSTRYVAQVGPYTVLNNFIHVFGPQLSWWVIWLLSLVALVVIELVVQSVRRVYFPNDQDLMQRIEKDSEAAKAVAKRAHDASNGGVDAMEMHNVGAGSGPMDEEAWTGTRRSRASYHGTQPVIQEDSY